MGEIGFTPPSWATQGAQWRHEDTTGQYKASVSRTSATDDRGARGWAYTLGFMPMPDGETSTVGWNYTFAQPEQLIYAPGNPDPREVLDTLAVFVSAWDEARRYGDEGSDGWDLFPESVSDFLGAAEEFYIDTADATGATG